MYSVIKNIQNIYKNINPLKSLQHAFPIPGQDLIPACVASHNFNLRSHIYDFMIPRYSVIESAKYKYRKEIRKIRS